MTIEKALEILNETSFLARDKETKEIEEAIEILTDAVKTLTYLKDRPCDVCKFQTENGCMEWYCAFEVWK